MHAVVGKNQLEPRAVGAFAGILAANELEVLNFAQVEINENRIGQRDCRQQGRITAAHKVAFIDLLETDHAVDRRVDVAIAQIQPSLSDPRLGGGDFGLRPLDRVLD